MLQKAMIFLFFFIYILEMETIPVAESYWEEVSSCMKENL